jgi:hypothetical protein
MPSNRKYKEETAAQFKKRKSLRGKARTSANKAAQKKSPVAKRVVKKEKGSRYA